MSASRLVPAPRSLFFLSSLNLTGNTTLRICIQGLAGTWRLLESAGLRICHDPSNLHPSPVPSTCTGLGAPEIAVFSDQVFSAGSSFTFRSAGVTLKKSVSFSEPQFFHLPNKNNDPSPTCWKVPRLPQGE